MFLPTVQASTFITGYTDNTDNHSQAIFGERLYSQTFTLTEQTPISQIQLKIAKDKQPGNLHVSVQTVDANQNPTGAIITETAVSTKGLIDRSKGFAWYTVTVPTATVDVGVYAVVLSVPDGSATWGNQKSVSWAFNDQGTYEGGAVHLSWDNGATWGCYPTHDFQFAVLK